MSRPFPCTNWTRLVRWGAQVAPLPDGWTEHEDDSGNVYYHQVSPPLWRASIRCTNRRASADADVFRAAE